MRSPALPIALASAVYLAFWAGAFPVYWIGDVGVCAAAALPLLREPPLPFDAARWHSGPRAERGRMLRGLARGHRLEGAEAVELTRRLGPHDCYVGYDDEPCYAVEVGGRQAYLALMVAHSGWSAGEVIRARLTTDPTAMVGGC